MLERLIVAPDAPPRGGTLRPERVVESARPGWAELFLEFPTVDVVFAPPASRDRAVDILASAWSLPGFDLDALDERVARAAAEGSFDLRIGGDVAGAARAAPAILTRYQRFIHRRNRASSRASFEAALQRHRALHDLDKPLVRADHDHALDTWHWVLRLDPAASLPVQLAALFHDIERLASEAVRRVEHRAPDYQAFKDAHARRGAEMTREALAGIGLADADLGEIARLVAAHERPAPDPELAVLGDADALSFFSLNSGGFLRCYGVEHTRKKIAYSRARLRPESRPRLREIRYCPEVLSLVREVCELG